MDEIRQIIQTGLRRDENGTQKIENNINNEHKERRICSTIRATDKDEQQYAIRVRDQVQYD